MPSEYPIRCILPIPATVMSTRSAQRPGQTSSFIAFSQSRSALGDASFCVAQSAHLSRLELAAQLAVGVLCGDNQHIQITIVGPVPHIADMLAMQGPPQLRLIDAA